MFIDIVKYKSKEWFSSLIHLHSVKILPFLWWNPSLPNHKCKARHYIIHNPDNQVEFKCHREMLHCIILPHLLAQLGSVAHHWPRLQRARSLAAFNVTLLMLVLEIPFNFQFDMQYARNANSNVSLQVNASFVQILFPWHTWVRSKGYLISSLMISTLF